MDQKDWAALFNEEFRFPVSLVDQRISREVLGDEYPEGIEAHSFLTRTDLRRFVDAVNVGPAGTLADIGCGRGGPGLWVAMQTGARLIGIDIAQTAVDASRARAVAAGLESRIEYRVGTFENTSLTDRSVDAVMTVDALLFTLDKQRAMQEFFRVLRPGGRLVFTSWDYHRQPAGRPPQVDDHRPLLVAAGFSVIAYEETSRWRERQLRFGELLLEAVDELAAETGHSPEEVRSDILEMNATVDTQLRRFLAVAERPRA